MKQNKKMENKIKFNKIFGIDRIKTYQKRIYINNNNKKKCTSA